MTSSILFYELYRVTTRRQLVSRGPYIFLPGILRYSKEPMKKLTTFLVSKETSCDNFFFHYWACLYSITSQKRQQVLALPPCKEPVILFPLSFVSFCQVFFYVICKFHWLTKDGNVNVTVKENLSSST